jgi:hypothetical protein
MMLRPRCQVIAHGRSQDMWSNPSLHLTCYDWLRQPSQAGELKR